MKSTKKVKAGHQVKTGIQVPVVLRGHYGVAMQAVRGQTRLPVKLILLTVK